MNQLAFLRLPLKVKIFQSAGMFKCFRITWFSERIVHRGINEKALPRANMFVKDFFSIEEQVVELAFL